MKLKLGDLNIKIKYVMVIKSYKNFWLIIKKNICCSARNLLEIYAARLDSTRIFLENWQLENARLEFKFPCSKSPKTTLKHITNFSNWINEYLLLNEWIYNKECIIKNDIFWSLYIYSTMNECFIIKDDA